jgi:hypothetical protein
MSLLTTKKILESPKNNLCKNPNFHKKYIIKSNESKSKNNSTCTSLCQLKIVKISKSETSLKKNIVEMLRELILGLVTNLVFHGIYLQKYSEPEHKILTTCTIQFIPSLHKISLFETSHKKL